MRKKKQPKRITSLDDWEKQYRKRTKKEAKWKEPKYVPFAPHPIPDWVKNSELPRPDWMTSPRKPTLPQPEGYCSSVGCGEHIIETEFFGVIRRHTEPKLLCANCYSLLIEERDRKQKEAWDYILNSGIRFM